MPHPDAVRRIRTDERCFGWSRGKTQAVAGTLVTFSLLALSISGGAILTERLGRTWDRLRGTSVHPAEMLAGKAVPVFAALLAQQPLIIGFGVRAFGLSVPHPLPLLAVLPHWGAAAAPISPGYWAVRGLRHAARRGSGLWRSGLGTPAGPRRTAGGSLTQERPEPQSNSYESIRCLAKSTTVRRGAVDVA